MEKTTDEYIEMCWPCIGYQFTSRWCVCPMWPSPGRIEEPPKQNGVFHLPKTKDEPSE